MSGKHPLLNETKPSFRIPKIFYLPLIVACGFYVAFVIWIFVGLRDIDFFFPVQDCIGITFAVEGYVVDMEGNPIGGATVRVWNDGEFEQPPFTFDTASESNGYFSSEAAFSYACIPFQVEVDATGYMSINRTFYPPSNEGFTNTLPDELVIQLREAVD
jgi:hypothetical protein